MSEKRTNAPSATASDGWTGGVAVASPFPGTDERAVGNRPQHAPNAPEVFPAGTRIGRYMLLELIGSGATGNVYGAYDPELDRKIALKFLKPSAQNSTAQARLLREAKALARLNHPNIVAVYDVGVVEGRLFIAMEFLAGGTLKEWITQEKRSWQQIVDMMVAAGRGLMAAHVVGLVHRDFKPTNVLLDKDGRPKVVDFGLAREAGHSSGRNQTGEVHQEESDGSDAQRLETLTRTGAAIGTPAYMAPEQFRGEKVDERTDQFNFCVALFEALHGKRPFGGHNMETLFTNVMKAGAGANAGAKAVPSRIRQAITRGLSPESPDRFPSMAALLHALEHDPMSSWRRRSLVTAGVLLAGAALFFGVQGAWRRQAEFDRQIEEHVMRASSTWRAAADDATTARTIRTRAFAAFDAMDRERGERLWRQMRVMIPAIDAGFDRAERSLDSALVLDGARQKVRRQLAEVLHQHILLAEDFRLDAKLPPLLARLDTVDTEGEVQKVLAAPGTLVVRVGASITTVISRYERDTGTGARRPVPVGPVEDGKPSTLAPGSYRLTLIASDGLEVQYPIEVRRGEKTTAAIRLPPVTSIPTGFVYVPPGDFQFGDHDEQLRTQFLDTVPIHRRHTDAFLIARRETTYAEWIAFLDALPPPERVRRAPNVSTAIRGSLRLLEIGGDWHFKFQPTSRRYEARAGNPIVYEGRVERARQDWRQFPVAGISPADANRYAAWLHSTGRLPGARLCTELEWERAARGADDRVFPHGDELSAEEANLAVTYGRVDAAYGPDVVGSFPASRSPFGVDDLTGNVFELVTSSFRPNELIIRGGAYYFSSMTCRLTNREVVPPMFRDISTGIRICASVPSAPS